MAEREQKNILRPMKTTKLQPQCPEMVLRYSTLMPWSPLAASARWPGPVAGTATTRPMTHSLCCPFQKAMTSPRAEDSPTVGKMRGSKELDHEELWGEVITLLYLSCGYMRLHLSKLRAVHLKSRH